MQHSKQKAWPSKASSTLNNNKLINLKMKYFAQTKNEFERNKCLLIWYELWNNLIFATGLAEIKSKIEGKSSKPAGFLDGLHRTSALHFSSLRRLIGGNWLCMHISFVPKIEMDRMVSGWVIEKWTNKSAPFAIFWLMLNPIANNVVTTVCASDCIRKHSNTHNDSNHKYWTLYSPFSRCQ